jgi:hypothetical protein
MNATTGIEWTETGRSLASNGYVLIRVGKGHPLADVRGYAYEHRLVASKTIGRWVLPTEQVHHKNEIKTDNRPENLEVMRSTAEHHVRHRKADSGLRLPGQPNPQVQCGCGCGWAFAKYDEFGRPRQYISGHNPPRSQQGTLRDMVLWYLGNVPQPGTVDWIASCLMAEPPQVRAVMYHFKNKGVVVKVGHEWRLVHV